VRLARERLRPGSKLVITGIGGLGHVALQIARATTAAEIIAVDVDDERLALAERLGADRVVRSDDSAVEQIRDWCEGLGADVVLDYAGVEQTVSLARNVIGTGGRIVFTGLGGGVLPVVADSADPLPHGVDVSVSIYGGRQDLREVTALMAAGRIEITSTTYSLDDAPKAWDDLVAGRVLGRAVVIP
jgi:propanol-preferring alcohol dehydrogenase